MKTRGLGRVKSSPFWIPAYVERMQSYVALTCFGSGRQVMTVSCASLGQLRLGTTRAVKLCLKRDCSLGFLRGLALLYNNNHGKAGKPVNLERHG